MAEMNNQTNGTQKKSIRGFAAMDQEKQREIARKGGRAAHEHVWLMNGAHRKQEKLEKKAARQEAGKAPVN